MFHHDRELVGDFNLHIEECEALSVATSDMISDHLSVVADLRIPTNHSRDVIHTIMYRMLMAIDINSEAFKAEIKNSELIWSPKTNATELVWQCDSVLHTSCQVVGYPWMTPGILPCNRHRRYLECIWHRNPALINRSRLTRQTHLCNRLMWKTKSAHYSKLIAEHSGDHPPYGGHLTKSYPIVLKCTSQIVSL